MDTHQELSKEIMRANPKYAVTNPPVTRVCMDAVRSLLQADVSKRIGAQTFESFTDHPFFADIDFEALERKEIEPVFKPSSDKTNFDATYDLEELLLEEAPLEARARRQRPRERLKDDATAQEIREEELHRMIETLFEPFDYTSLAYDKYALLRQLLEQYLLINSSSYPGTVDPVSHSVGPPPDWVKPVPLALENSDKSSPVSIVATQKSQKSQKSQRSQKSVVGSPTSESPPIPKFPENVHVSPQQPKPLLSGRGRHGVRNQSASGGVSVTLDETGSWSDLADKSSPGNVRPKPSGMLGFLSKRKGRASSPKPQEPGVLGREGARVVIA